MQIRLCVRIEPVKLTIKGNTSSCPLFRTLRTNRDALHRTLSEDLHLSNCFLAYAAYKNSCLLVTHPLSRMGPTTPVQYLGKMAGVGKRSSGLFPSFRYSSREMVSSGQFPGRTRTTRPGRIPSMMRSVSKQIWMPLLPTGMSPVAFVTSRMGPREAM